MTTPADNKRLVDAFHHRLWRDGDRTAIDDVIAEDAVTHWGDFASSTRDAVREDVDRYFAGFVDVRTEIDDLIAEDDKVVLRWRTIGTHDGPYGKVPATGREVTMEGVDVYRIADGRIVEAWSTWDGLSVYQQLGLIDPSVGP